MPRSSVAPGFASASFHSVSSGLSALFKLSSQEAPKATPSEVPTVSPQPAAGTVGIDVVLSERLNRIKTKLVGQQWVWVGDSFVCAEKLAFACPLDATPYFRLAPGELRVRPFSTLLQLLGVRPQFLPLDYAHLLAELAIDIPSDAGSSVTTDNVPASQQQLSPDKLDLALRVAQFLSDHMLDINAAVYIPSASNALVLAPTLVYDDAPWLAHNNGSALISYERLSVSAHQFVCALSVSRWASAVEKPARAWPHGLFCRPPKAIKRCCPQTRRTILAHATGDCA
jgi:hypothetical protein